MPRSEKTFEIRKDRSWILGVLGLFFVLLIWDMGRFSGALEQKARMDFESLPSVDLIAVLTGGRGRLKEAFRLLESGQGRALLISGTSASLEDILQANGVENFPDNLKHDVILDAHSQRTFDNAKEIRSAVRRLDARSLLVVTSNYHMQRTLELIQEEFAKAPHVDIVVYTYPVMSPNFDPSFWWRRFSGWRLFMSEYFKTLGSKLGY
ncbi:MAG: YdcF family protein [Bdellovibrionota bacterium]